MEITYMNEYGAVYVDCDDVHITLAMTNEFSWSIGWDEYRGGRTERFRNTIYIFDNDEDDDDYECEYEYYRKINAVHLYKTICRIVNEFAMYYPDLEFDLAVVCVEFLRRINGIENVIDWAEEIENE